MYDSSFDSTETQPYFEAGSLIKLENGECKKVEELSRADFETVCPFFMQDVPDKNLFDDLTHGISTPIEHTILEYKGIMDLIFHDF